MKYNLSLLLIFIFTISVFPQSVETEVERVDTLITINSENNKLKIDSLLRTNYKTDNKITQRKLRDGFKNDYLSREFDYNEKKPKETAWQRMRRKIAAWWDSLFADSNPRKALDIGSIFFKIIILLIIAFTIYLFIKAFVKGNNQLFFWQKSLKKDVRIGEIIENIHEVNFDVSIAQYEKQKDFRSAIRYLFLQKLKLLSDKKLIIWNPEKTNRDYYHEIQNKDYQKQYQDLSFIFEYVWYGELSINEEKYLQFKKQFLETKF